MTTDGRTKGTVVHVGDYWEYRTPSGETRAALSNWHMKGGDFPGWSLPAGEMCGWTLAELREMAVEAGTLYPVLPGEGAGT